MEAVFEVAICDIKEAAFGGELKREILWKPRGVAPDLLIEALGGRPVQGSQFGIEDNPVSAQGEDRAGDILDQRLGLGKRLVHDCSMQGAAPTRS